MRLHLVILSIILEVLLVLSFYCHSRITAAGRIEEINRKKGLVRELMLTDLAIWTEARYTRHPSQADLFTPFQDYPASLEHFPAGSIVAPPVRGAGRRGW